MYSKNITKGQRGQKQRWNIYKARSEERQRYAADKDRWGMVISKDVAPSLCREIIVK